MLSRKFSSHQVFEKKGCKKYKKNTIYIKKKKCFERETNPVQKNMNFLHSTAKFTLTNYIWKKCFLKLASNTKCSLMPPAEIEWPQSLSFIFFLLCTQKFCSMLLCIRRKKILYSFCLLFHFQLHLIKHYFKGEKYFLVSQNDYSLFFRCREKLGFFHVLPELLCFGQLLSKEAWYLSTIKQTDRANDNVLKAERNFILKCVAQNDML